MTLTNHKNGSSVTAGIYQVACTSSRLEACCQRSQNLWPLADNLPGYSVTRLPPFRWRENRQFLKSNPIEEPHIHYASKFCLYYLLFDLDVNVVQRNWCEIDIPALDFFLMMQNTDWSFEQDFKNPDECVPGT